MIFGSVTSSEGIALKHSAGIFLYNGTTCEFLIVHPAGAYNKKAPWHIPKGEIPTGMDPADIPRLRSEALRELKEETGLELPHESEMKFLGSRKYKSGGKTVHAFLARIDTPQNPEIRLDAENDQYKWVSVDELASHLHEAQQSFLEELRMLGAG